MTTAIRCRAVGFTLIEVMIAVAIVGILAAIAYPSYQNYVRQARRSDAYEALLRVQLAQEKWRANNAAYGSQSDLGIASSADGYYTIAVTGASATGFIATATAKTGTTQVSDSGCTALTLTVNGGTVTQGPAACWKR